MVCKVYSWQLLLWQPQDLLVVRDFVTLCFSVCKIKYSFNKLLMIAMIKRANGMIKRKKRPFPLANPMVGPIFVLRKRFAGHLADLIYAYNKYIVTP